MQHRRRLRVARVVGSALGTALGTLLALLTAGVAAAHGGSVPDAPPDLVGILTTWRLDLPIAVPLVLVAAGWVVLVLRIGGAHPDSPVPLRRSVFFLGGLAAIAVALLSGIDGYDTVLFSVHMIQHLLLAFVAAPLLALGAPVTVLLRAASPGIRSRWILPILHSRLLSVLSHPVVAWLLFTSVMWIIHFSPLFDAALEDPGIHRLEHSLFLVSALLFWWPVVGLDPAPHRMGHAARIMYAFLQMPQNSFLAMAVLFAEDPLYHHYATLGSPYGIDALADQKLAAGYMWFFGDLLFLGVLAALLAGWMRREQLGAVAADRRTDIEREALRLRADELAARKAAPGLASGPGDGPAGQAPGIGEASSSR